MEHIMARTSFNPYQYAINAICHKWCFGAKAIVFLIIIYSKLKYECTNTNVSSIIINTIPYHERDSGGILGGDFEQRITMLWFLPY